MSQPKTKLAPDWPGHRWLRPLNVHFAPGPMNPLLGELAADLLNAFGDMGHSIQETPDDKTELIITTATFGEPINWRKALLFNARRRYRLRCQPQICTLIHATALGFKELFHHFQHATGKSLPDANDFDFPGLAQQAFLTLFEQGKRGGPILALERLLQAQSKCLRIILFVGDESPVDAFSFDLVGAYPKSTEKTRRSLSEELATRLTTALSSGDVTDHQVTDNPLPLGNWQRLSTPAAMRRAGQEFDRRQFFTQMVRVADLVEVPSVSDAIASQYSEGCYATWDPDIGALVTTATGSIRPIDKGKIRDEDLAIVAGVRDDGIGALVQDIENLNNQLPSSEAVEMFAVDADLPTTLWHGESDDGLAPKSVTVPVARSKLHGHRGVSAFDPSHVEFVQLARAFHDYPVSCGSAAQADAICDVFSKSEALRDLEDPRQVVFTVLPGHGIFLVEKWRQGKRPFQLLWEYMDKGRIQIDNYVPQGRFSYQTGTDGRKHIWLSELSK